MQPEAAGHTNDWGRVTFGLEKRYHNGAQGVKRSR